MNNVIYIFKSKRVRDITCSHCGQRVRRSQWKISSSWSWWCKDNGAKHGPISVDGREVMPEMSEKTWLEIEGR
jgi:hypothetical protein